MFPSALAAAECSFADATFVRKDAQQAPMSVMHVDRFCDPFPGRSCAAWNYVTPTGSRFYHAEIPALGIAPAIRAAGDRYDWVTNTAAAAPDWIELDGIGRFERICP